MKFRTFTFFLFHSLLTFLIAEENTSKGSFSGYMIGDYYYNIQNHNSKLVDQHGFWFRRIYFTYDYKIDKHFSSRLRLEMNNDGSYTDAEIISPFIKDAYLSYKIGNQKAYFGISSPPTFSLIEKVWGYRSVEKTALDLQRMASSRDFGISVKGQFDSAGKYKYHIMYGNGSGNKQEIDKGKSFMSSFSFWATKNIVFQIYGDYADRPGSADTYIAQAFLGYLTKNLHGGLQYSHQTLKAKDNYTEQIELNILSFFVSKSIFNNIKLIGRIDKMFDQNPNGEKIAYTPFDNSSSSTMLILGLDYNVASGVSIIPNIKYVLYDENNLGIQPTDDLYAWLTLFWKFK
jgi:hypothetical protein